MLVFSKQLFSHFGTLFFFNFQIMSSLSYLFLKSKNIRRRDCRVIAFISIFTIFCEHSGFLINFRGGFATNPAITFSEFCSVRISMKDLLVFTLEPINVHLTNIISKLKGTQQKIYYYPIIRYVFTLWYKDIWIIYTFISKGIYIFLHHGQS